MNNKIQPESRFNPRHFQMVMNILMVSVMLTCFSALIGRAIQIYYPDWDSYWFPLLTFFITFISMLTRYVRQFTYESRPNPLMYSLVEAILILILAKTVSILSTAPPNFSSIWLEITSWGQNFLINFANPDFLLRAFSLLVVWFVSMLYSGPLNQLQEDEVLMEQEKLGYTFNDRYVARRKLISLVFNLGFVMIIVLVIQNSTLPVFAEDSIRSTKSVGTLIIYFFTAFIFLALNQYAIMKARWYFNNIKVSPDLIKRWIFFSFIFVFLVILVIVFLPTGFTLEIPELGQWLIEAITAVFSFVFSIILAPFVFVMMLIERLSNGDLASEPIQEAAPELPELFPQIVGTMPWWDVVKSILFWIVFIAMVVIVSSYYFKNTPSLKNFFSNLRISSWFRDFWKWLVEGLKQAHKATVETLQTGLDKIQTFIQRQQIKTPGMLALIKRLPPRLAIILIYVDWINWNQKHGVIRNSAQTPLEYAQTLINNLDEATDVHASVDLLTDVFIQARYSKQPVLKGQVQEAQQLSQQLKLSFQRQQEQQESLS
jgi:hypothetical protein